MDNADAHYHGGGKRIVLESDAHLAVDLSRASEAGIAPDLLSFVRANGVELRADVFLVGEDEIDGETEALLERTGALAPVFRDPTGALVVVLPEIRVEVTGEADRRAVRGELDLLGNDVEVVRDRGDQLLLRPASGRSADALRLANRLYEKAGAAMAQPRFLRLVKGPGV